MFTFTKMTFKALFLAGLLILVGSLSGELVADQTYGAAICKNKTLPIEVTYREQGNKVSIKIKATDSLKKFSALASGVDGLTVLNDINIQNIDIEKRKTITRSLDISKPDGQSFIKLEMSAIVGRGAVKQQISLIPVGELTSKQKEKRAKGVKTIKVKPKNGKKEESRKVHILNE